MTSRWMLVRIPSFSESESAIVILLLVLFSGNELVTDLAEADQNLLDDGSDAGMTFHSRNFLRICNAASTLAKFQPFQICVAEKFFHFQIYPCKSILVILCCFRSVMSSNNESNNSNGGNGDVNVDIDGRDKTDFKPKENIHITDKKATARERERERERERNRETEKERKRKKKEKIERRGERRGLKMKVKKEIM